MIIKATKYDVIFNFLDMIASFLKYKLVISLAKYSNMIKKIIYPLVDSVVNKATERIINFILKHDGLILTENNIAKLIKI